jgi:60 kDa SS-A/Ro ribonucleoprotein
MTFASLVAAVDTRSEQRNTPVHKPIPGRETEQIQNNTTGFSFKIDGWTKLERFLIIGNSTFYVSERKTIAGASDTIKSLILQDGQRVVNKVVEISQSGRARNNDFALLVLAMAMTHGNDQTKRFAASSLPLVARIGTHLMHFVSMANSMRGWGKTLKWAVANWYQSKTPDQIAYQAIKYQQRDGWSQRDILRLAHPKAGEDALRNNVYKYIVKGIQGISETDVTPGIIQAFEAAKTASEGSLINLITDHRLSHEMIPNEMKNRPAVWEALYQHMGTTALVRNLNKLTALGLLNQGTAMAKSVVYRLNDVEVLRKDRIHPLQILIAQRQYAKGHGDKGSLVWTPSNTITYALETSFYQAFQAVEPTGKNLMLALDVSASMNSFVANGATQLTCREAATVMAMVTARKEPNSAIFGFDHKFRDLGITANDNLKTACEKTYSRNFGSTNCSLPMQQALQSGWKIDGFAVYTDNEVSQGANHPSQALVNYRNKSGKQDAKLISVGMTVSDISIADPKDRGMIDVIGFDAGTPAFISAFVNNQV